MKRVLIDKNLKRLSLILFLALLSSKAVQAQNCTQQLNRAEDDYEEGRLIQIPDVVNDLLRESDCLSKEEKVRARKLLTKVYIFLDEEAKAEDAMIRLLKSDPEHILSPQFDPKELFFLMDQFRTDPIFRIAIKVGVNSSIINTFGTYSTANPNDFPKFYNGQTIDGSGSFIYEGQEYDASSDMGVGYSAELTLERHLVNGFEVGLGGQIRASRYNLEAFFLDQNLVTSLVNKQTYFRTPLFVRYNLWYDQHQKHKLKPYVFAGLSADFLLSAKYQANRSGGTSYTLDKRDNLIEMEQVNTFDFSALVGVGVKFRVATHYLTLEARYDNAFNNYINAENRYSNRSSVFDLAIVEDNLSLNMMSITFGWTHSIYSPKKVQSKRK